MREIGDLLLRMPRPLLLLLKTNDCLRAVDNALGSPMNTVGMGGGAAADGAIAKWRMMVLKQALPAVLLLLALPHKEPTPSPHQVVMTARECTRALADIRSSRDPGLRSWWAGRVDALHVEVIVAAMHAAAIWAGLKRRLGGWGGSSAAAGKRVGISSSSDTSSSSSGSSVGEQEVGEDGLALPPLEKLPAEFVAATTGGVAAKV
jgi:hypothetical protein